MDIHEIIAASSSGIAGVLLVLLTVIQIAPCKLNPWSLIGKFFKFLIKSIGNVFNSAIMDELKEVRSDISSVNEKVESARDDINELRSQCEERDANLCRTRIMRFGDELLHGIKHSKEHFEQILIDIDSYESYCKAHSGFKNNVANATIKQIKQVYQKCLDTNSFL